jgi:hypothetical protein
LAVLPDRVVLGPILITILEDEPDISFELAGSGVCSIGHLGSDGTKIHGVLDDVKVVWNVIND